MKTSMKWAVTLAVMAAMLFMVMPPTAFAAEKIIDLQVTGKTVALDRNGAEYVRLIVNESRKIQGVEYEVGIPAMAFGTSAETAKTIEVGQNLKAIVNEREFNGRQSYTILKLL